MRLSGSQWRVKGRVAVCAECADWSEGHARVETCGGAEKEFWGKEADSNVKPEIVEPLGEVAGLWARGDACVVVISWMYCCKDGVFRNWHSGGGTSWSIVFIIISETVSACFSEYENTPSIIRADSRLCSGAFALVEPFWHTLNKSFTKARVSSQFGVGRVLCAVA